MAFYAVYDRIVPAQNKYMATLFNTSATRKVVVSRIYRVNSQLTAVVGVLLDQELRFITARTAGTAVTIQREDTADTLSAGITADHASTAVTEGTGDRALIRRFSAVNEEYVLATLANTITGGTALLHDAQLIWWRGGWSKGLVLRQQQGVTIKNLTNSVVGSVSYAIVFDDEPI